MAQTTQYTTAQRRRSLRGVCALVLNAISPKGINVPVWACVAVWALKWLTVICLAYALGMVISLLITNAII